MTAADSLRAVLKELVREVLAEQRTGPQTSATPTEHLSTGDAAELASVAPGTIRRWIREGRLEVLHAGRELRIRRADLEQLMKRGPRSVAPASTTGEISVEERARRAAERLRSR